MGNFPSDVQALVALIIKMQYYFHAINWNAMSIEVIEMNGCIYFGQAGMFHPFNFLYLGLQGAYILLRSSSSVYFLRKRNSDQYWKEFHPLLFPLVKSYYMWGSIILKTSVLTVLYALISFHNLSLYIIIVHNITVFW
jgi:hypothetical protein